MEQKDNSGAMFRNDKKEKETHPDYKGTANIAGLEYWVSGWIKTAKTGSKYMSLSLTPKQTQPVAELPVIDPPKLVTDDEPTNDLPW